MAAAREQFSPRRVADLVRLQERRLRVRRPVWQMLNAAYLTRFWELVGSDGQARRWLRTNVNGTEIEVNRLWRGIMTYKASLYRRSGRLECVPAGSGTPADPVVASAVGNAYWSAESFADRMDRLVELSLLFPGAAAKVGVEEGTASPVRRTWSRVVPWWELLLDADVGDTADERYRGHRYWLPLEEVEAKYGCVDLHGSARRDYLGDRNDGLIDDGTTPDAAGTASSEDGEFVEVLEFCNLRDAVTGRGGVVYKGRQEIYILGQSRKEYEAPVFRGPLAFADADGVGLPHVEPLIFCHEPSFPNRGVSPCERILPQLKELNVYRTKLAELVRLNARKGLRKKGTLTDDQLEKLFNGNDGEFPEVEDSETPLSQVLWLVPNQPLPAEFWQWMGMVEADYNIGWGQVAPAQGQPTEKGKTAYANQIEQFWTETEIGYHGKALSSMQKRLVRLLLRATLRAMTSVSDAAGATGSPDTGTVDVHLGVSPLGSAPAGNGAASSVGGVDAAVPVVDAAAEMVRDGDADAVAVEVAGTGDAAQATVTVQSFTLVDDAGKAHRVTAQGLDGEFDVRFLEGARTPMTDASVLQFLMTQGQTYFAWFDQVLKGGPVGMLAQSWMTAAAERAQLPPELHVAALLTKVKQEAKHEAKRAPQAAAFMPGGPRDDGRGPAEAAPNALALAPAPEFPGAAPSPGARALQMAIRSAATSLQDAARAVPALAPAVRGAARMLAVAEAAEADGDVEGLQHAITSAIEALGPVADRPPPEAAEPLGRAAAVLQDIAGALVKTGGAPPPPEA